MHRHPHTDHQLKMQWQLRFRHRLRMEAYAIHRSLTVYKSDVQSRLLLHFLYPALLPPHGIWKRPPLLPGQLMYLPY